MKKILKVMLSLVLVLTIAGCGSKEEAKYDTKSEYAKYIEAIRNSKSSAYYYEYTLGELYDNALSDSKWDRYTKELAGGLKKELISVKGTSKFGKKEEIEVVYEINTESLEFQLHKTFQNGESSSANIVTLLKESADDLQEKKK